MARKKKDTIFALVRCKEDLVITGGGGDENYTHTAFIKDKNYYMVVDEKKMQLMATDEEGFVHINSLEALFDDNFIGDDFTERYFECITISKSSQMNIDEFTSKRLSNLYQIKDEFDIGD